ncbi:MAG: HEAT repeat domain-containing protein [Candidatus Eremiobacterota bacterium]
MRLFQEECNDFRNDAEERESLRAFFARKKIPFTEEALIGCLHPERTKNEIYLAILALRDLGTERCLEALRRAARFKYHDCQSTAALTLAQIGGKGETRFLGDLLLDRQYRAKDYALWALLADSNEEAVPQVLAFLEATLKHLPEYNGLVRQSVAYLRRHPGPEVDAVLEKVRARFQRLDPETQTYLRAVGLA